ncbi:MAG: hypothetical protein ACRDA8_01220 [Shewanella sp.]
MKNSNMPAMPVFNENGAPVHWSNAGLENDGSMAGLTKREMMAMHIASGFAADNKITTDNVVKWSIEVTDKLLSELERTCQKS